MQVIFRKRATNYRAILRKMTCEDMASYGSLPLCIRPTHSLSPFFIHTHSHTHTLYRKVNRGVGLHRCTRLVPHTLSLVHTHTIHRKVNQKVCVHIHTQLRTHSLSHTHAHTHAHTHTHTRTHIHTHTHTHTTVADVQVLRECHQKVDMGLWGGFGW